MKNGKVIRIFGALNFVFGLVMVVLEITICILRAAELHMGPGHQHLLGLLASGFTTTTGISIMCLHETTPKRLSTNRLHEVICCAMTFISFGLVMALLIVFCSDINEGLDPPVPVHLANLKMTVIVLACMALLTMAVMYILCVCSCMRVIMCRPEVLAAPDIEPEDIDGDDGGDREEVAVEMQPVLPRIGSHVVTADCPQATFMQRRFLGGGVEMFNCSVDTQRSGDS